MDERTAELLRALMFQVNEAACAARALKLYVAPGAGGREAALVLTAIEEAWLRAQQCAWECAGLDGLPLVERPWAHE